MYYQNVRVKAPEGLVGQLIRQTHQTSFPLSTLFHFLSLSFAVTHPAIDTNFHNSGWSLHFCTPLAVEVSDFILFSPLKLDLFFFLSVTVGYGVSSNCAWQRKGEYRVCVFSGNMHTWHNRIKKNSLSYLWFYSIFVICSVSWFDCRFKEPSFEARLH